MPTRDSDLLADIPEGPFQRGDVERLKREFPQTECMLSLPSADVPAGTVVPIDAHPQVVYRPRRLVVEQRYPSLFVIALKVGSCYQTMSGDAFPLDALKADERLERIEKLVTAPNFANVRSEIYADILRDLKALRNNLGRVDTCQVAQRLTLILENKSEKMVHFAGGLYYGDAIY
jgi:hypothetical protein